MSRLGPNVPASHGAASELIDAVRSLRVRGGHEKSFRLTRGSISTHRFLLTVSKASLGHHAQEKVQQICTDLVAPPALHDLIAEQFSSTAHVHFGFEDHGAGCLYKLYLESQISPRELDARGPVLLHRAMKWDPVEHARFVSTNYFWHPRLPLEMIERRVAGPEGFGGDTPAAQVVKRILLVARARLSRGSIGYLEVVEQNNPRRSFDLNLYNANLRICDVHPLLEQACRQFEADLAAFQQVYNQAATCKFGHLAGGVHRNGQEFLTIYYGAEGWQ
jgi:tryptophan 7-halogenase